MQATSPRRSGLLPTITAILSASLLGIGLAYGACTVLIPAAERSQDVICSSGDGSTGQQAARADQ